MILYLSNLNEKASSAYIDKRRMSLKSFLNNNDVTVSAVLQIEGDMGASQTINFMLGHIVCPVIKKWKPVEIAEHLRADHMAGVRDSKIIVGTENNLIAVRQSIGKSGLSGALYFASNGSALRQTRIGVKEEDWEVVNPM